MPAIGNANAIPFFIRQPVAGWTPAEISTDLWLDAADSSTITQSLGKVSQWRDKSGNLRHANQAEGAAQPTTGGNINGVNAISFTGNSIRMDSSSASYINGAYTLYVVAELDNIGVSNNYYIGTGTAVVDQGLHLGWSSPTVFKHAHYADDKDYSWTQFDEPVIFTNVFKNPGSDFKYRNFPVNTSGFPQNPLNTADNLRIGTGRVLSENWDGSIGEMILLTRQASAEDDANIFNYLSAKWSIPELIV